MAIISCDVINWYYISKARNIATTSGYPIVAKILQAKSSPPLDGPPPYDLSISNSFSI